MFKRIELWHEPIDILSSLPEQGECEMTKEQQGFLCGMIREKSPIKVLEVGVASGGTSCVIMETLERVCAENGTEAVLHSVDFDTRYYRDRRRETGYMAKNMQRHYARVRHQTYYGEMLPEYIDIIGGDIDFVILDTSHHLPGEVLDFLLVLPYLQKNATVVLHDIMLPLLVDSPSSCATSILMESVQADKYLLFNNNCPSNIDNIGAFTLNSETIGGAANIFLALLKRWSYGLTYVQEESYKRLFLKHYDEECLQLFVTAISLNRMADYRDRIKECYEDESEFADVLRHWTEASGKIIIYGIGFYGEAFVRYSQVSSLRIDALVVTDGQALHEVPGSELPIYALSELPYMPDECTVIIAVKNQQARRIIEKELRYKGFIRVI